MDLGVCTEQKPMEGRVERRGVPAQTASKRPGTMPTVPRTVRGYACYLHIITQSTQSLTNHVVTTGRTRTEKHSACGKMKATHRTDFSRCWAGARVQQVGT